MTRFQFILKYYCCSAHHTAKSAYRKKPSENILLSDGLRSRALGLRDVAYCLAASI